MSTPGGRLGPALVLALLAASLAVAALVYRARTPDLALEVPRIERNLRLGAPGEQGIAQIRFFVRFDEPDATVQMVGAEREPVRTLYTGELTQDEEVVCTWDGRDDEGELVTADDYRLRVVLPGQDRDMVYPRRIDARGGAGEDGEAARVDLLGFASGEACGPAPEGEGDS